MEVDRAYDSDKEPPPGSELAAQLDWRLDPEASFSDWTVLLTSDDDPTNKTKCYHVHKAVLAVGSRMSNYFKRLFQSNFAENSSQTSNITLPQLAIDTFPIVLDYMYGAAAGRKLNVNEGNATALHFLGQYFEIPQLRWDAKQFWKANLWPHNCHVFCEHATLFRDEKITDAVAKLCITNSKSVSKNHDLFRVSELQFWLRVIEKFNKYLDKRATSGGFDLCTLLSPLVERLCQVRAHDIDAHFFTEITNIKFLPAVTGDLDLVKALLDMESKLVNPPHDVVTCLQERCLHGLALELKSCSTIENKEKAIVEFLQQSHPHLLSRFWKICFDDARKMNQSLQTENRELKRELENRKRAFLQLSSPLQEDDNDTCDVISYTRLPHLVVTKKRRARSRS